jgi:hypothetical protein
MPYDQRERWNDPEEATRHAHEDHQTTIWTSMPCIIKEHNVQDNTAKVQIAIKLKHVDEKGKATWVPFPILEDVPVHYYGGGGVTITPPIKDGDEGIIHFNARSIDKWWQQGGVQEQTHARMHDISDGWLMPGGRSQPRKLSNVSKTSWQLRTDDGNTYVDFDPAGKKIKIVSPDNPVRIEGELHVTKKITCEDEVIAKSTGTNIHLSTHTHDGVTTGTGNTSAPNTGT